MKVLVKRDQYKGILGTGIGKVRFELTVRAELTPEEWRNLDKYCLGKTVVYRKPLEPEEGGFFSRMFDRLMNAFFHFLTDITMNTLIHGKTFVCKDVVELIKQEGYILESFKVTRDVLEVSSTFGGEQMVEF